MSAPLLARAILTAIAAGQGLAPLFIDLNRTHATNPLWPGHARFHVVWQTFTQTLIASRRNRPPLVAGSAMPQRFYLAAASRLNSPWPPSSSPCSRARSTVARCTIPTEFRPSASEPAIARH